MAFDLGAGVSAAGNSLATTTAQANLEDVKADLEKQKVVLADQLAGAREEKQRGFLTSERLSTQTYQSGENTANRTNALAVAQTQADAAVKAAGIHAGGEVAAANIGLQGRREEIAAGLQGRREEIAAGLQGRREEIAAGLPIRQAQVASITADTLAKTIATSTSQAVDDARKELAAARASGDADAIRAAQQKEYDATYSSDKQVQQVSVFQAQARIAETTLSQAQQRYQQATALATDPIKTSTPEGKAQVQALVAQTQKQVDQAQRDYQVAVSAAAAAAKNLPTYSPPTTGAGSVIQYDARGNRITPSPMQAPATSPIMPAPALPPPVPGGIINNSPSP